MSIIAIIIFITLTIITLLHLMWANGIYWPAKDEYSLVKMVIGEPNMRQMPSKKLTYFIALAIFLGGIIALWGANIIAIPLPLWIREFALFILAFIFGTRGLAPFLIAKQMGERTQPFKSLDRSLYAPLCLLTAIGFIIFLVNP